MNARDAADFCNNSRMPIKTQECSRLLLFSTTFRNYGAMKFSMQSLRVSY